MIMIYVTGDLHGEIDSDKLDEIHFPQGKNLTRDDYVIICGDFGYVLDEGPGDQQGQRMLEEKPWTTLFIDGNHENFDLLATYPIETWHGGKIQRIQPHVLHPMRGSYYTLEGQTLFVFGGASSTDKMFRKAHTSWWAEEMPNKKEYQEGLANLAMHHNKVDYILTHTGPTAYVLDLCEGDDYRKEELTEFFGDLDAHISFKHWYFGHFHFDHTFDHVHTVLYRSVIPLGSKIEIKE